MTSSKFIIFEGNEGTGKSTHISFASSYLTQKKVKHIVTREPGGTPLGESIRSTLLDQNSSLDALSEALLFYASRIINYNQIILNSLEKNEYVICDRFHYSTLVYQGIAVNDENVIKLHKVLDSYFSKNISLIFHLDASIENCLSRIESRSSSDKFENQGKDFLVKIKNSYNQIFENNNKVVKIMTDSGKENGQKIIATQLDKLINEE